MRRAIRRWTRWVSGLENFDAIGDWRTQDGKLPIDSSGTLPGGKTFNGVDGLKKILLARRDQFCHCLAEKMLTYALGRALEDYDAAAIDQIAARRGEERLSVFELRDRDRSQRPVRNAAWKRLHTQG